VVDAKVDAKDMLPEDEESQDGGAHPRQSQA
jgi:hypothetical protein